MCGQCGDAIVHVRSVCGVNYNIYFLNFVEVYVHSAFNVTDEIMNLQLMLGMKIYSVYAESVFWTGVDAWSEMVQT